MTIKELKQTAERLATEQNMTIQQATDMIKNYKGDTAPLLAGDFSPLAAETTDRRTQKPGKASNKSTETKATEQTPPGSSIESDITPELLPPGLHDDIVAIIDGFAESHDIKDKYKIDPRQFSAICTLIGETVKARGILRDREREKREGGRIYNGEKLTALLLLYAYICDEYRQVAFTFNFQRFAGVSREYFHDYKGKNLTSVRADITQKANELQRASITASIASNSGNVVGSIFLGKALAGLQETVTVQHVSASPAPVSGSLPVFDSSAGGLIESRGE